MGTKGTKETGTKRQKVVSRDAIGSAALARHLKSEKFLGKVFILTIHSISDIQPLGVKDQGAVELLKIGCAIA